MPEILLRKDVYFCQAEGRYVFLDFASDAYYALDAEKSARFGALLSAPHETAEGFEAPLADLAGVRLLAGPGEAGKPLRPTLRPSPSADLSAESGGPGERGEMLRCLRSCLWAGIGLAARPLGASVAAARRRKPSSELTTDRVRISALLAAFARARDFFPRRRTCLFDSLSLLHFLSGRGVAADWTFGVRLDPFTAHCWLERDGVSLGEDPAHLALFTPIAVI
jgi:hypothetical protein